MTSPGQRARRTRLLCDGRAHEIADPSRVISLRADNSPRSWPGKSEAVWRLSNLSEQCERITRSSVCLGTRSWWHATAQEIDPRTLVEASIVNGRAPVCTVACPSGQSTCRHPHDTGDPRLLEQALINLLLNACDASPPGASVQVSLATDAKMLLLSVADQGPSPKTSTERCNHFSPRSRMAKALGLDSQWRERS